MTDFNIGAEALMDVANRPENAAIRPELLKLLRLAHPRALWSVDRAGKLHGAIWSKKSIDEFDWKAQLGIIAPSGTMDQ